MNKTICFVAGGILLLPQLALAEAIKTPSTTQSTSGQAVSQQQLDELQDDYDRRLSRIEKRLHETQKATRTKKANTFNPAISLILNGSFASYSNDPNDYQLPGFALGGEAGLAPEGFSLGESEITLGASVDQQFYGQATFSMADNAGETSISAEEAYFETLALPQGLKIKAGRFFSAIGYINGKHTHAWDFGDAPLVYRGMFGDQLKQDGVQLSWLLPTDTYFLIGGEAGNSIHYPAAGGQANIGDWSAYIKTGGDIGISHSWQLGLSHWQANDIQNRASQGMDSPMFAGNSRINGLDAVYKWAPQGNPQQQNLKLQAEYFQRDEAGQMTLADTGQAGSYNGKQRGWYTQAVYQFVQQWKVGLRYDRLSSDNTGSNNAVLDNAGLLDKGHTPHRSSVMLSWRPSEFSRIRAQYNRDDSTANTDNQFFIQYTMVMGAHGAHSY
jgi:hypothetical protein